MQGVLNRGRVCARVGFTAAVALAAGAPLANASWTVITMGSTNAYEPTGIGSGQIVGVALPTNPVSSFQTLALVWNTPMGQPAVATSLHPTGFFSSRANGVGGGQQVGSTIQSQFGTPGQAALWTGAAASRVNLHPSHVPNASSSEAFGVAGGQQVGVLVLNGSAGSRAGRWSGSAASWVDLTPPTISNATAYGTDGAQQVGHIHSGNYRAALWSGTAASFVNLHPTGFQSSEAFGVANGQQVGYAELSGSAFRAALWTGSAASFVNLNPVGGVQSRALAAANGMQVGWAIVNGRMRASFWNGTAASWEDLYAELPFNTYSTTQATGISTDGNFIYIVGWGDTLSDRVPLLWVRPVPAPGAAVLMGVAGLLVARRRRAI